MTTERQPSISAAWVAVLISVLVVLGDIGKQYYTGADAVMSLSGQVTDLKAAIQELNNKIGNMPRQADVTALTSRMDNAEAKISDLYNIATGLRHDLDNRLPAPSFRSPQH